MPIRFHTPGIPLSSNGDILDGLTRVNELGLDGLELEFVRSVFVKKEKTQYIKEHAEKLGLSLTVHAPYYINLASEDKQKIKDSIDRIVLSAEIGYLCGAKSCCFHPAYYGKLTPEQTYKIVKSGIDSVVAELQTKQVKINLAPETMGRKSQFGSLEELLKLSQETGGSGITTYPCIDFSHLYAREGKLNGKDEFRKVLENYERACGKHGLKNMHVHLQGIAFSEKGEKNHTIFKESDIKYVQVLETLKEFGAEGHVVCESPNVEQDTMHLKEQYLKLK